MTGRPEILWPLFGALDGLDGVGPKTAAALNKAGVEAPVDLLLALPHGGIDRRLRDSIRDVVPPGVVTVSVTVGRHVPPAGRGPYRIHVDDGRTEFRLVFFHAHPDWVARTLPQGARRIVSGRIELYDGIAQMAHPDHIVDEAQAAAIPPFEAIHPLPGGIAKRLHAKALASTLARAPDLPEWIDPGQIAMQGWPSWRDAMTAAHAPTSAADLSPDAPARTRLAYDELLAHQLTLALARAKVRRKRGRTSQGTGALRDAVLSSLPYAPTMAQMRALAEIDGDMSSDRRMSRLLQGDVGSGKTLVALLSLLRAVEAGGQGALMAPTEILARQHLEGLAPLAHAAGARLDILTGRDTGAARRDKLSAIAEGRIQIVVGTHALFQKGVEFRDLRLAVVDEQHRFGVAQRMELAEKGVADVLVMTATPIPRSLELAQYGDMDVSILDEKPPGRQPIATALISTDRMDQVVERLRAAVAQGRRAYWVCPLVEESEQSELTAAQERFKHLRAALGEGVIGLVHGQMPGVEKDAAMAAFVRGDTQILVATTVIEVGVNVPEATIMVIERAESFGLAQLHQLRGRVGRGAAASTCLLLFGAPLSEAGRKRLEILRGTEDGFEISEADLKMRGAGDVIGTAQSGLPRMRIADPERQTALMAVAQSDARKLLHDDPDLTSPRGRAARHLLWLLSQDRAIGLMRAG
ncbi:MAG: ATP-dependent DNA helicase RecG [Paracoccaceae bacterium]